MDKRIFPRTAVDMPAQMIDVDYSREAKVSVYDISPRGLGLFTAYQAKLGSTVEILVRPQPQQSRSYWYARGRVVWSKPVHDKEFHCGILLDKADHNKIQQLIKEYPPQVS